MNNRIKGPGFLSLIKSARKQPHEFLHDWMLEYGDIVRFKFIKEIYIINSFEISREILQKVHKEVGKDNFINQRMARIFGKGIIISEGEEWLRERRILHPAFHKINFNRYFSDVDAYSDEMILSWKKRLHSGETILNITSEIHQLLMRIISKTLIGFHSDQITQDFLEMMEKAAVIISSSLPFNFPDWIPGNATKKINQLNQDLDRMILNLIEECKTDIENGKAGILSILLNYRNQDNLPLEKDLIIDEIKSILLAGVFTTSDAILWSINLLERNLKYKSIVKDELKVWLNSGADIKNLHQLTQLNNCIYESLRLFPPVWSMWYHAKQSFTIGKYLIPQDSVLLINLYNIHRNSRDFKDPEAYFPGRFDKKLSDQSFIPYGYGPRKCIGANFASAIIPIVIAKIMTNFETTLDNVAEIKPKVRVTLTQNKPLFMRLKLCLEDNDLKIHHSEISE